MPRFLKYAALALCAFFPALQAGGQLSLEFENLNSRHGLSTEEVRDIIQDNQGYMWFLTREGVNRHDGYQFEVYKRGDLGLGSTSFECACEDQQGRLWLGTMDKGIEILDPFREGARNFEAHSGGKKLVDQRIRSLHCDRRGRIWIGTEYGVQVFHPEQNRMDYLYPGNPGSTDATWCIIEDILEDREGNIWLATWSEGLYRIDAKDGSIRNFSQFDQNDYTEHANQVKCLYQDGLGYLWVGTWEDGLYMTTYRDGKLEVLKSFLYDNDRAQSISGNIIYSISEDEMQRIWVGTPYGLTIIEGAHSAKAWFTRINYSFRGENGIPNNEVWKIYRDRSGLMWLGTLEGGASKVHPDGRIFESFSIPPVSTQIFSQTVQAFCTDPMGRLLIGVKSLGFGSYDLEAGTYTPYTELDPYSSIDAPLNTVNCFGIRGEELWLGTRYQGLLIVHTDTRELAWLYDLDSSFLPFHVKNIRMDGPDQVWVGSEEGLYRIYLGEDQVKGVQSIRGLEHSRISSLQADSLTGMWVATEEDGIFVLDPDSGSQRMIQHFSPEQGNIPSGSIHCLFRDSRGSMWAGSADRGLLVLDTQAGAFVQAPVILNVNTDAIMGIAEDPEGNLWLTSNRGMIRIYRERASLKSDQFTISDGLQGKVFLPNAIYQPRGNRIFAGGYYGFNAFYPSTVKQNRFVPPTVINQVLVNDEPVPLSRLAQGSIELGYNQNNIEISFSSLSFHKAERNTFAYQIPEVSEQWHYLDATQRSLLLPNMRAGSFKVHIKSANSSGVWNEDPAILGFTILPAPWKTWWAVLIYVLIVMAIMYAIIQYLLRSERTKRAYELEKMEHARDEKLNKFKLRFFTNISHELLTPLSIMNCSIENLKGKTRKGRSEIGMLERNIQHLNQLLSQLLDFRKMESGHLKLQVVHSDIHELVRESFNNFQPLAARKQLVMKLLLNKCRHRGYVDPDKIHKVLHNLLSNAIKYTPAGGMILLEYNCVEENQRVLATIKVSDSGVGIKHEDQESIFDRFFRSGTGSEVSGAGIGLALSRNLVELHHGTISMQSEPGKGSVFEVRIPLQRSAYKPEELKRLEANPGIVLNSPDSTETESTLQAVKKGTRLKIMIVEDNDDFRKILAAHFSSHYKVIEVALSQEAMALAIQHQPDIIISDVMMPGKSGLELSTELKKNIETSRIPLILLTARTTDTDIARGYDAGADAYLTKPVSLPVLHAMIASLIRKKGLLLSEEASSFETRVETPGLSDQQFIVLLKKSINKHLSDSDFQVSSLHQQFGMSASLFYRRVKECTRLAPVEYLKTQRLNRASQLLRKDKMSVAEVAYECGFSDQSYFGVCFKKQFGMTPTTYVSFSKLKNSTQ